MFPTKAAVLRGARLIGRRSLHRRQPPGAAGAAATAAAASPRDIRRKIRATTTAGFSAAAPAVDQPKERSQGERFPSLLITADAITAE